MDNVKYFDTTNIDEDAFEQAAIDAEIKMQEYRDRIATGMLTEKEKQSIKNNEKLIEYMDNNNKSIFDMTAEDFKLALK